MLNKLEILSHRTPNRWIMAALPQTSASVQVKALYQRLGRQRPSFWRGFAAAVACQPLIQAPAHRSMESRCFGGDLDALRVDREQALSQLLNA